MVQTAQSKRTEFAFPLTPEVTELKRLDDPNLSPPPLLNAENLTLTSGDRLFVTGSESVFEIKVNGEGGYTWTPIALPDDLPSAIYRNGIAADDRYLYLACAEVDQEAQPLLRSWVPQLTERPQEGLNLMLFLLTLRLCPLMSIILRADLSETRIQFREQVRLAGDCFANGLAVDKSGFVYVAGQDGIHRVRPTDWTSSGVAEKTLWHRTDAFSAPNGVKVWKNRLYFTKLCRVPLFSSMITALKLDERPHEKLDDEPKILDDGLCRQNGVMFDDFDVVNDFTNVLGGFSGALVFFDKDGVRQSGISDPRIKRPSAVIVLPPDTKFGEAGDLLLTEKHTHTVWRLRP